MVLPVRVLTKLSVLLVTVEWVERCLVALRRRDMLVNLHLHCEQVSIQYFTLPDCVELTLDSVFVTLWLDDLKTKKERGMGTFGPLVERSHNFWIPDSPS